MSSAREYTKHQESVASAPHFQVRAMLAVVALINVGMAFAHVFTNLYTKDGVLNRVRWGLWEHEWCPASGSDANCVTGTMPTEMCGEWDDRQRTMQAFAIFICIWAVVTFVASLADVIGLARQANFPDALPVGMTIFELILSLVQLAVIAGTFRSGICGFASLRDSGYRLSASFSLSLCIFLSTISASFLYIFLRFVKPQWD